MQVGILKETAPGETRVSMLPQHLKALAAQRVTVTVEAGAGDAAGASDAEYVAAGAIVVEDRAAILTNSDLLPVVTAPGPWEQAQIKRGALLAGFLRALDAPLELTPAIQRGVTLLSVELIPRITRAQSMDALSSMATVAGYKAVIMAADQMPKLFPMLMTAAGTIPPARVLVIGAGVAGLQAIATARRLGAVVEAFDVRTAAGEQVKSLGAKFLDLDLTGITTEGGGGYAAELTEEALDRARDLITKAATHSDLIITTAQVPGRPAPRLIRSEALDAMRPGSVLVDMAAPTGGNCELTKPGLAQKVGGVTLLAPLNLPATVPVHSSQLYSRNLLNLIGLIVKNGEFIFDVSDGILAGCCVAYQGHVVHPRVAKLMELEPLTV